MRKHTVNLDRLRRTELHEQARRHAFITTKLQQYEAFLRAEGREGESPPLNDLWW